MKIRTSKWAPAWLRGNARDGRLGRLGWTTADQAVFAGSNAALSFIVARTVGQDEFGAFALAFVTFAYTNGISRGLVSDPLVVRFSGAAEAQRNRATADAAGAAVVLGAGLGLLTAAVGVVVGGLTGTLLMLLGLLTPGLMLQDLWRYAFFASGRPQAAFVNDTVWAVLQIGGVIALARSGRGSDASYLAAWGLGALVAAMVGVVQAGLLPRISAAISWLRDHRDIGLRFSWGFLVNQGAFNAAIIAAGGIAGLAAVGALRGAQILTGPVRVLQDALLAYSLPQMSAMVTRGRRLNRLALVVSAGGAGAAVLWTVLLLALPTSVGEALMGDSWSGVRQVLAFVGLQWVAVGIATGFGAGLKALSHARLLLRLAWVQAVFALALGVGGAAWGGAVGAAFGMLVAQCLGATYCWWLFRQVTRQPGRAPEHRAAGDAA